MVPLSRFMPDALVQILSKAPLTDEKVMFAWRTAVGSAVDKVTSIRLDGRVLRVRVRDAAWQREIERSAALIRTRLEPLLGVGVVRGLEVTVEPARRPSGDTPDSGRRTS